MKISLDGVYCIVSENASDEMKKKTKYPSMQLLKRRQWRSSDVGGAAALSRNAQNYSSPPRLRETEKRSRAVLPKPTGARTPGDHLQPCRRITTYRRHRRGAPVRTQSSLPGCCKCPRFSGSPRSGTAWEGQQSGGRREKWTASPSFLVIKAGKPQEMSRSRKWLGVVGGGVLCICGANEF